MRFFRLGTLAVAATALSLAPAYAQGRGGAHIPPTVSHGNPHTTTTSSPTTTSTTSGTTTGTSSGTTTSSSGSTTTSGSGSTSTSSTSTSTTTPLNPIAAKISSHPQLASRLTSLLPQGMSLNDASSGFRNQGQFIAALHVSKNLNIPFTQLKNTMLGLTTTSTSPSTPSTFGTSSTSGTSTTSSTSTTSGPMSLGQAIHTLRPSANSTTQANLATTQASTDLKTSTTTTTTTSGK